MMELQKTVRSETIEKANENFMNAFSRGDASILSSLYTEDGQLLPANAGTITGQKEIQGFWQAVMDMGIKAARLETEELEILGSTAIEVGKYTLLGHKDQVADSGKYIVIWKSESGQWKLHRDIWTTSLPATSS